MPRTPAHHTAADTRNSSRLDVRFESEPNPKDLVYKVHFRTMIDLQVDGPFAMGASGEPCMRMLVTGESFMMHQIRYMVGAAVQVALGIMPLDLLKTSLLKPCRIGWVHLT